MPATVEKRGEKWRVVEKDGSLVTQGGSPVDGGGHESKSKARSQAKAINASQSLSKQKPNK